MGMPILIGALLAYVIAGVVTTWLGWWWFVGYSALSMIIATLIAVIRREYWPVVNPAYSLFYVMPVALAAFTIIFSHPREWAQWLGWSLALAAISTGVLTLAFRRRIDREWAVAGTFCVVFATIAFALDGANTRIGPQTCQPHLAAMLYESAGGYRQGGPRVTVSTEARGEQTFFVDWDTHTAAVTGKPLCVLEYSGGLGWRWSMLAECTEGEIERALSKSI